MIGKIENNLVRYSAILLTYPFLVVIGGVFAAVLGAADFAVKLTRGAAHAWSGPQ